MSTTVPVYIAEIAPWSIRGRLVSVYYLFMTGAEFVASVVDGIFSPYKKTGWRLRDLELFLLSFMLTYLDYFQQILVKIKIFFFFAL